VASVVSYIFFLVLVKSQSAEKKITKDAKQMNISFIRERHRLFKEGTNANVKRCNKSTTRYLVFKNRKSGGKKEHS